MRAINSSLKRTSRVVFRVLVDKPRTLMLNGPAMEWLAKQKGPDGTKFAILQGWLPRGLYQNLKLLYAASLTSQKEEGFISFEQFASNLYSEQITEIMTTAIELLANVAQTDRDVAPYEPTDLKLLSLSFAMLKGREGYTSLYDLGCGDGRVLAMAGTRGYKNLVGYETNPERVKVAHTVLVKGLGKLAVEQGGDVKHAIIQDDFMDMDFSKVPEGTVIFAYLLPLVMQKLAPLLEQTPPGTLVMVHDFSIDGWTPAIHRRLKLPDKEHSMYLYEIGKHVERVVDFGKPLSVKDVEDFSDDVLAQISAAPDESEYEA